MYLRRCFRRKDGKRHAYWALVESYRTNRGPRQRVVAWLGVMDEQGRLGVKRCAEKRPGHQTDLFRSTEPEWVEVDVKRVRVERSRKFGGPWLGKELLRRLALDEFLEQTLTNGREEIPWSATAMLLLLARLCEPSSELHLAEHVYQASALLGLLGIPDEKVGSKALLLFGRARSRLPYGKWPTAPQEQHGSKESRRTNLPRLREAQAILGPAPAGMPGRPRQRWRRGRREGEPRREISTSSELPRHERKNPADLPAFPWLQSFASPSTKRLLGRV